jgi:hypothetical protein
MVHQVFANTRSGVHAIFWIRDGFVQKANLTMDATDSI